jgi:uncharacterized damage-inducible protein DinB
MDEFLCDLMSYSEWANAVFFHVWGKSPAREQEEMRTRVDHIVGVQNAFLSIFKGEGPGRLPGGPPPTFTKLQVRAETSHADLNKFTTNLDSATLSQTIRIPWFQDPPCVITVAQALVQVAMHTQHHRGQCMTRLRDFGGEPKTVDWIIWLWQQKPRARWS